MSRLILPLCQSFEATEKCPMILRPPTQTCLHIAACIFVTINPVIDYVEPM